MNFISTLSRLMLRNLPGDVTITVGGNTIVADCPEGCAASMFEADDILYVEGANEESPARIDVGRVSAYGHGLAIGVITGGVVNIGRRTVVSSSGSGSELVPAAIDITVPKDLPIDISDCAGTVRITGATGKVRVSGSPSVYINDVKR